MKNVPLIYALAMLRFPYVPHMERYRDGFLEGIRADYPLVDVGKAQRFDARIAADGLTVEAQETSLWQFVSADRRWGFVLSDQTLCLHTAYYKNFTEFVDRFRRGILSLHATPGIGINWVSAVGIRYVNMISPVAGESLDDYLQPWVLSCGPNVSGITREQSIAVVRYSTKVGELRVQSFRNPPFTLPPELTSSFVTQNGWVRDRPESEFVLMDIDHGTAWEQPRAFDVYDIGGVLQSLREPVRAVFDSVGSAHAVNVWEKS